MADEAGTPTRRRSARATQSVAAPATPATPRTPRSSDACLSNVYYIALPVEHM